jgi:hypothetical protein
MRRPCLLLVLGVSLSGVSASASEAIPAAYRHVAAIHGVPADLFYAVALTESGRTVEGSLLRKPWPWTLNIGGEGHFFTSRVEAWLALDASLRDGRQSVDVGLMQVNWRYHQTRLKNSWLALEPYSNLGIAAEILSDCYRQRRDWWASVGCYHAPADERRAARYRNRVMAHWRQLNGA